jgi:hypothetical protein
MRLVKRAAALTRAAVEVGEENENDTPREGTRPTTETEIEGGNVMMRSVLIDAISTIRGGSNDPKDIAQLANAWARLTQGHLEAEKLQLKTETKLQMAFEELSTDLRNNAEAKELFDKLFVVVKRLDEQKAE